ncbi:MAG: hypothetical protein KatS3mg058_2634 [Roseiflexus sp.]|nr:MAG: hypothetical protein KatS3mg058_2634 [Roseiflexus sp.]
MEKSGGFVPMRVLRGSQPKYRADAHGSRAYGCTVEGEKVRVMEKSGGFVPIRVLRGSQPKYRADAHGSRVIRIARWRVNRCRVMEKSGGFVPMRVLRGSQPKYRADAHGSRAYGCTVEGEQMSCYGKVRRLRAHACPSWITTQTERRARQPRNAARWRVKRCRVMERSGGFVPMRVLRGSQPRRHGAAQRTGGG